LKDLETLLKNRNEIETLVLAPGSFDLFHAGHLKYLKEAKKLGTLVVSVSSDRYVGKGINRPVFHDTQRAEIIEALEFVDYVVINNEPNCCKLIDLIKPDIYCKSEEFKTKSTSNFIAESESVSQNGGRVVLLPTQLASSSHLINNYMSNLPESTNRFLAEFKQIATFEEIKTEIAKLQSLSVTLIGESIIDRYCEGEVLGLSSKNPAPVLSLKEENLFAGGAIAIANHLSSFCSSVNLISYLGENEEYKDFIKSKLSDKIRLQTIKKRNSPTIVKSRFIDAYHKTRLFETYEINQTLLNETNEQEILDLLPASGNLIVADFGHGLMTPRIIREFYRRYAHICVNVQCNAGNKGYNFLSKYHDGMYYASIDITELRLLMREKYEKIDDLALDVFNWDYSPMYLSVTKGKEGASLYNSFNGRMFHCPAMTTKISDSVGSGDTAFAVASLLMLSQCRLDLIPFIANVSAGIACQIVGNERPIYKDELLQNIETLLK